MRAREGSLGKVLSNCQPRNDYRPQFLLRRAPHFLHGGTCLPPPALSHCRQRVQGTGLDHLRLMIPCGFPPQFTHSNVLLLLDYHLAASTGKERSAWRVQITGRLHHRCLYEHVFNQECCYSNIKLSWKRKNQREGKDLNQNHLSKGVSLNQRRDVLQAFKTIFVRATCIDRYSAQLL